MIRLLVLADFDFQFFRDTLFSTIYVGPALLVLLITLVAQTAGVILGFPLALGRISTNRLFRWPVNAYLWLFRGTPLLLQLLFFYDATAELTNNSPLLYPINRNNVIAGIVALSLNEAAYMTEIIRAGLQAVEPGQVDAAKALGMRRMQVLRRIVIPQALRIIVPPTGNEYINMSKNTSLLAFIAVGELLQTSEGLFSTNFRFFEALSIAALWYLAITTVLTYLQSRIEARFGERQEIEGLRGPGFLRRTLAGGWHR